MLNPDFVEAVRAALDTDITIVHHVKSWCHFYKAIKEGRKLHDLCKDDRGYNVGDTIRLHEYDNIEGKFTGESIDVEITYITDNRVPCAFSSAILPAGYCILSIKVV